MRSKLANANQRSLISPLIDIVFNAMAAMFILLVIYISFARPVARLRFVSNYLPPAELMSTYEAAVAVSGGSGSYHFFISEGKLPPGLELDPQTGRIYGTPFSENVDAYARQSQDAVYKAVFRVRVRDTRASIEEDFSIVVYPIAVPFHPGEQPLTCQVGAGRLFPVYVGQPVDFSFGIIGGIEPYQAQLTGVPPGLRFDRGRLSGVPTKPGDYRLSLEVTDQEDYYKMLSRLAFPFPVQIQCTYQWRILPLPPKLQVLTPSELPDARASVPYKIQFAHTGGVEPIRWTVTGDLPEGLDCSPGGLLSGEAKANIGSYTFAVAATDASGDTATRDFTLTVRPRPRPLGF